MSDDEQTTVKAGMCQTDGSLQGNANAILQLVQMIAGTPFEAVDNLIFAAAKLAATTLAVGKAPDEEIATVKGKMKGLVDEVFDQTYDHVRSHENFEKRSAEYLAKLAEAQEAHRKTLN